MVLSSLEIDAHILDNILHYKRDKLKSSFSAYPVALFNIEKISEYEILLIYVCKNFRKKGLGTKLLNKIDQGFDVVSGWRYKRQDSFSKKIFSKLAHELRRIFTGEKIHDSGCSLKAYRKECFDNLDLYGEMHRYIPAILKWRGFKITEVKVNHKRRQYGKTKYNLSRVYHGFLDLILVDSKER